MVQWLTRQTSNLTIAGRVGSNQVSGKSFLLLENNFTIIA
jgi:hypothetical protein